MPTNIIPFPRFPAPVYPVVPARGLPRNADEGTESREEQPQRSKTLSTSDGRRKKGAKSRSIEPNIQEIPGVRGGNSYRVQIRKSAGESNLSFTHTFSTLAMARMY